MTLFVRHDGRFFHAECAPDAAGEPSVAASEFDEDEVCGECGDILADVTDDNAMEEVEE